MFEHGPYVLDTPYLEVLRDAGADARLVSDLLDTVAFAITSSPLSLPWACALCLVHAYFLAGRRLLHLPQPPTFSATGLLARPACLD
eukprot:2012565-Pleurochrysis_carterae.AAC.1